MSEVLEWLAIIGFFGLMGVAIFGAAIVIVSFADAHTISTEEYQDKLAIVNATYQETFLNYSKQFQVYQATFDETEPFVEMANTDDFLRLCQKWNKTAILYDPLKHRRTGFLGLLSYHSSHFWFYFEDNNITVQARLTYEVEKNEAA